jgi:DNA-binding transcriptional LysR family regulator
MDLNAVRTFIEVVRAGGFSAAARRLGMPRSTVSLHVRTLEENLGLRLFKRSTRAVVLTEEGRRLFDGADTALGALAETVTSIGAVGGELKGVIRVTAPADFPTRALAEAIGSFRARHPRVTFDVILSNSLLGLVSDNIDIALRIGIDNPQDAVIRRVFSTEYGLFASPAYLQQHGEPTTLAEVRMLILPPREMRSFLERHVFRATFPGEPAIQANNFLLIRDLAAGGQGVGVLPVGLCTAEVEQGRLRRTLPDMTGAVAMGLSFPNHADMSERVRAFADHWARELPKTRLATAGRSNDGRQDRSSS